MIITKSEGFSPSEKLVAELCDKTFLRLWSYPNVFKADGKELCDVIAVFENHVFLFFVRESKKFDDPNKEINLQWQRWKKEAIDKQIATLEGAEKYIRSSPDKIFLDLKNTKPFPIPISGDPTIHKIVVALGVQDACKQFSPQNLNGSLGVIYADRIEPDFLQPFVVKLERKLPVHIFDSHNLQIILSELDTVYDFSAYLASKENAISKYDSIFYSGEEDLLAHYFRNYDESSNTYKIGVNDERANAIMISEGEWNEFILSEVYKRRWKANQVSEVWDNLLQRTCDNALMGVLQGNGDVFNGQSALHEMAKEPRFIRRALSEHIISSIKTFPENISGIGRHVAFMPSFYPDRAYVFLQLKVPVPLNQAPEYRANRQTILEIACGAAKNKFPHLKKVIGIAIDAPKFSVENGEDLILMDCEEWSKEQEKLYDEDNRGWGFFQTGATVIKTASDFPRNNPTVKQQVSRNAACPCGSGKKYKRCCAL